MVYRYNIEGYDLLIDLNNEGKTATVFYTGSTLCSLTKREDFHSGKRIMLNPQTELFIKFINPKEGFTVMLNNRHIGQSAGHPKKLMKRTLLPIGLSSLVLIIHFLYVLYDLFQKGELQPENINERVIGYLSYHLFLVILAGISYWLARQGNWKGAALCFATLFSNLFFTIALGLYYRTGFNEFTWFMMMSHSALLVLLFNHYAVIRYIRAYTKTLAR